MRFNLPPNPSDADINAFVDAAKSTRRRREAAARKSFEGRKKYALSHLRRVDDVGRAAYDNHMRRLEVSLEEDLAYELEEYEKKLDYARQVAGPWADLVPER